MFKNWYVFSKLPRRAFLWISASTLIFSRAKCWVVKTKWVWDLPSNALPRLWHKTKRVTNNYELESRQPQFLQYTHFLMKTYIICHLSIYSVWWPVLTDKTIWVAKSIKEHSILCHFLSGLSLRCISNKIALERELQYLFYIYSNQSM